jgi:hypothetical protein
MFEYLKNIYKSVRNYFTNPKFTEKKKQGWFYSLFAPIINYFSRREPIFTEEQRDQFENNLGSFRERYNITYGHGTIFLRPKGLEKRL